MCVNTAGEAWTCTQHRRMRDDGGGVNAVVQHNIVSSVAMEYAHHGMVLSTLCCVARTKSKKKAVTSFTCQYTWSHARIHTTYLLQHIKSCAKRTLLQFPALILPATQRHAAQVARSRFSIYPAGLSADDPCADGARMDKLRRASDAGADIGPDELLLPLRYVSCALNTTISSLHKPSTQARLGITIMGR